MSLAQVDFADLDYFSIIFRFIFTPPPDFLLKCSVIFIVICIYHVFVSEISPETRDGVALWIMRVCI